MKAAVIITVSVLSMFVSQTAKASTSCNVGVCTVAIAKDPGAATNNFQTPGATAQVGYSITTFDDGTYFDLTLTTDDASALPFVNLYFDTIASTPNTGSNLGFEFGANSQDAFDPNSGTKYNTAGQGITATFVATNPGQHVAISIPNTFFLNNPLGMPFTPTPPGTYVSLHLSQSFSYSVVGGSANFAAPVELGYAMVGTSTPEPAMFLLTGFATVFLAFKARRKKSEPLL